MGIKKGEKYLRLKCFSMFINVLWLVGLCWLIPYLPWFGSVLISDSGCPALSCLFKDNEHENIVETWTAEEQTSI